MNPHMVQDFVKILVPHRLASGSLMSASPTVGAGEARCMECDYCFTV